MHRSSTVNLVKNVSDNTMQQRKFMSSSMKLEVTKVEAEEKSPLKSRWKRIREYTKYSSIFIFHKDNSFRRFCMSLAETPENLLEFVKADKEGRLENYNPKQTTTS